MLGISFRIFCGLCDSEVDFRSLGRGRFGRLGVAFGVHFGSLELPLECLGRHLGVILGVLGCCGGPFCGSGGAPGHLRRAVVAKDRLLFRSPPFFNDLGPQRVTKRHPKWN